eukprot:1545152-Alexandrium_andersonii.AAC.1
MGRASKGSALQELPSWSEARTRTPPERACGPSTPEVRGHPLHPSRRARPKSSELGARGAALRA